MEEKIMLSKEEYKKMVGKIKSLEEYIERDDLILVPKEKNRIINLYANRYMNLESKYNFAIKFNEFDINGSDKSLYNALIILGKEGYFRFGCQAERKTEKEKIRGILYGE